MLREFLMYAVLPLWVLAGIADWWCHKRAHDGNARGLRESLFHLTLFLQMAGIGVAALWLEINLAVFALLLGLFLMHEATTWMELRGARTKRDLRAGEQMLHGFLEVLPLVALLCLFALHEQEPGAWGAADAWRLHGKSDPLPPLYVLGACVAIALLNLLPPLEDMVRCLRARRQVAVAAAR